MPHFGTPRLILTATLLATWFLNPTPAFSQGDAPLPAEPLRGVPATPPQDAPATIQLQDGFRAELIAAEPLVTDPIAMQYDENGLAYVVEMNDYPYSDKSHDRAWEEQTSEPIGRIRVLEDVDGDGIFDKSTVFADKLSWPSGLALWKGGVFVAATPDVWYLKDTDGDHRADIRRRVFTGFRKYNVQAVMNGFQWGLDHRIYAAGSSNGGDVTPDDGAGGTVRLGRSDFRIDPRTEKFELVSGGARFGNTFDDWGHRFLCNIRNPVQHVLLPARYLQRNKFLPVSSALHDVARSGDSIRVYPVSPPEAWRVINARRQAAETATKPPFDSTVPSGYITSSSGVTIYRGAAWPAEYRGHAFIGEVAGNLVMHYKLTPDGVTFAGERAHEKSEFLASTDNWFRPVNFVNAPDGNLHVLDMYRETIEHPWSMPDDLKARVDLTSGRDRGRIYRIVPTAHPPSFQTPPPPRLGSATTTELVAALENPNSWWRETAHRLLFERQDAAAVAPLRALLRDSNAPLARLHALWSLHGLDALEDADLQTALRDSAPGVREHAVLLTEPRLNDRPELLEQVYATANDEAPRVRFQTALTLGEVRDSRAPSVLADIARRDRGDPWMRIAVLSSLADAAVPFLLQVLDDPAFTDNDGRAMIGQLAYSIGARNASDDVAGVLAALPSVPAATQSAVITNLGAGLKRAGGDLSTLAGDSNTPGAAVVRRLLDGARDAATSDTTPLDERQSAIALLAYEQFDTARDPLARLLDPRQPDAVQLAALAALTSFPKPEVADILLDKYPSLTPSVRMEVANRLLIRTDWVISLFDAIAAGTVSPARISDVRRTIYMKSTNTEIRTRAEKLFGGDAPSPRKSVIADYQPALALAGTADRGRIVFRRECAGCHKLENHGHDVGPNLATVKNRTAEQLLVHILDPNREVSPNYFEYIVVTVDGRIETGVIASETPASLTLKQPNDKRQAILRTDIEELRSSGKSAMPEGLEKKVTPQEMADLIAYLLSDDAPDAPAPPSN